MRTTTKYDDEKDCDISLFDPSPKPSYWQTLFCDSRKVSTSNSDTNDDDDYVTFTMLTEDLENFGDGTIQTMSAEETQQRHLLEIRTSALASHAARANLDASGDAT